MSGRKEEHNSDGETENKLQDGRHIADHINNSIKCK